MIEVDCDGVLLDIGSKCNQYLAKQGFTFNYHRDIPEYSMSSVPENIRKAIFSYFRDAAFMTNINFYAGALAALVELANNSSEPVVVRTLVFTPEVAEARYNWLSRVFKDNNISVELCVEVANKKAVNSRVLFEDNLSHLAESGADVKVLVLHSYNKDCPIKRMGNYNKALLCDSFSAGVSQLIRAGLI